MTEEHKSEAQVGHGSPAGKRWFISKYPEYSITMRPQDIIVSDKGKERPQKALRIAFTKQVKPWRFTGDGTLGSQNPSGTDRNDSPYWGVYVADVPSAEDADKIDKKLSQDLPLTPKERKILLDKEIVDFLREHELYRKTTQDNQCEANALLKELNWDPRSLEAGTGVSVLARGREKLGDPHVPAPADTQTHKPSARVADMGRKSKEGVGA